MIIEIECHKGDALPIGQSYGIVQHNVDTGAKVASDGDDGAERSEAEELPSARRTK